MFTLHPTSNLNGNRDLERKLTASVQRLSFHTRQAAVEQVEQSVESSQPESHCENGVCLVTWKPQRPAA